MARDHEHNPDPNANAARIVAESTGNEIGPQRAAPASASQVHAQAKQTAAQLAEAGTAEDVEAAWAEWSSHIQNVDQRGMTLLKAAFEAGFGAGRQRQT